jgi:hypothetical protein
MKEAAGDELTHSCPGLRPRVKSLVLRSSRVTETPPATRTVPSGRAVAVWASRGDSIFPVSDQIPVEGLYTSAVLRPREEPEPSGPPLAKALPLASSVRVVLDRMVLRSPVKLHVLVVIS